MSKTLEYYERNARAFADATQNIDFSKDAENIDAVFLASGDAFVFPADRLIQIAAIFTSTCQRWKGSPPMRL